MVKHSVFRNITAVQTHPLDRKKPCYLVRELEVPRGKKTLLQLKVSHHPHGDWQLRVLADQLVSAETVTDEAGRDRGPVEIRGEPGSTAD